MSQLQNVLLLCGGKSAEHEISIRSAKNVLDALDKTKFAPIVLVIDRNNHFHLLIDHTSLHQLYSSDDLPKVAYAPAYFIHKANGVMINTVHGEGYQVDVVFPVLHGPYGEDGTMQGLLEVYGVPYVGCGVVGSAIAMDKRASKIIAESEDIATAPSIVLECYCPDEYQLLTVLFGTKTLFVKPLLLGSSVGISKVRNKSEYKKACEEALKYDTRFIVEAAIPNAREIEVAVMQCGSEIIISEPGELRPTHEFYSYEAKYLDPKGAEIITKADLSEETAEYIKECAHTIFESICATGMARVDFFMDEDGGVYFNEINTIPGFTSISMFPMMMGGVGIDYTTLITKLIESAFYNFKRKQALKLTPDLPQKRLRKKTV